MTARRWAYYNDVDEYCCAWTKNLIKAGLIPDGEVDNRSIRNVEPDDVRDFAQCHFFSGIAGFAYAARLAGWPDDAELWTGGFPCQPFSVAGRQLAAADDRHLWPELHRLVAQVRPAWFLGENVAGIVGLALDGVLFDLESAGYACRAFVVPACAVDAPHRRDRVWIAARRLADTDKLGSGAERQQRGGEFLRAGEDQGTCVGDVADTGGIGCDGRQGPARGNIVDGHPSGRGQGANRAELRGEDDGGRRPPGQPAAAAVGYRGAAVAAGGGDVEYAAGVGRREGWAGADVRGGRDAAAGAGFWSDAAWIGGADGKARRVPQSGIRGMDARLSAGVAGVRSIPLIAQGVQDRVGKLKALGNAIVPQVAAEILKAMRAAA